LPLQQVDALVQRCQLLMDILCGGGWDSSRRDQHQYKAGNGVFHGETQTSGQEIRRIPIKPHPVATGTRVRTLVPCAIEKSDVPQIPNQRNSRLLRVMAITPPRGAGCTGYRGGRTGNVGNGERNPVSRRGKLSARRRKNEFLQGTAMTTSTCSQAMIKVLVVEPDPIYRKLFPIWIRDHFGSTHVQISAVSGPREAEEAAQRWRPDVLLTAYELEGTDGLALARHLRDGLSELRVVVISQVGYPRLRRALANSPKTEFLAKPVGEQTFVKVIDATFHCPANSE
jgi:CheY-like chemotaxis protein